MESWNKRWNGLVHKLGRINGRIVTTNDVYLALCTLDGMYGTIDGAVTAASDIFKEEPSEHG